MKRKILFLALALTLVAALLSGCGNSTAPSMADRGVAEMNQMDGGNAALMPSPQAPAAPPDQVQQPAKRIYTARLEMETTAFDVAVQSLADLVEASGGWFASSSVNNRDNGYRYGNYTVRVPVEKFDAFCTQAGDLCHLIYSETATEDVSEYYYDTAGRLQTQQSKLARLQELLAKAENMEDLIAVESAISDTESTIESLSGELQHYDALVDESTVQLSLSEVYQLSNVEQPANGFFSRLGGALSSGWKGFVSGMESLMVALAYSWVWLLILVAVAVILVRRLRNRPKKETRVQKLPKIKLKKDAPEPTAPETPKEKE